MQLYLRKQGKSKGYTEIKQKIRGKKISQGELSINLPKEQRDTLIKKYLFGEAPKLIDAAAKMIKKNIS